MDSCNNKLIPGTSNFWKLDKIDKIVISLWFIIFTIFCVSDCFAVSSVESSGVSSDLFFDTSSGQFQSDDDFSVVYFDLVEGHNYTLTYDTSYWPTQDVQGASKFYGILSTQEPSAGVSGDLIMTANLTSYGSGSFTFVAPDNGYLVFSVSAIYNFYQYFDSNCLTLVDNSSDVMQNSVDSLVNNVGQEQIWSIFDTGIPIALLVVLVAFGIFIIGFASRKIQKGKMGI